ncbi:hypothetical protein EDB19DRAFT_1904637 [Suillus lakei]|nr:hypothetical protein EDB19DRAFT_1904637 [Suillus lakei]
MGVRVRPKGRVASSYGSKGPDFVSEGETVPSISKAPKVRLVIVLRAPKRKLAEMQGDDFVLTDSRLSRDDLVMVGKLQSLYAQVHTIQGLLSKVANELDVIHTHLNNKAGSKYSSVFSYNFLYLSIEYLQSLGLMQVVQVSRSNVQMSKSPMSNVQV